MLDTIRQGLAKSHDKKLVDELLEAYVEAKRNFYLGGLRLSAVEGGRFCEAAFRISERNLRIFRVLHTPSQLGCISPGRSELYTISETRETRHIWPIT